MTIYGKGCISNYRNCSLSYVWYSVLYRMLTESLDEIEVNKPRQHPVRTAGGSLIILQVQS